MQELLKADLAAFGPQHSATVAARGVLAEMTAALGRAVRLFFARKRHYQERVHVLGHKTYHASRGLYACTSMDHVSTMY